MARRWPAPRSRNVCRSETKASGSTRRTGRRSLAVHDVSGDGTADVVGGDPSSTLGSAYVVYGRAAPTNVDLQALTALQGFRIDGGAAGDDAGISVAGDDVSGDGICDVIIGARFAGNNGRQSSGSAYVVYGNAAAANVALQDLAPFEG